MHIELDTFRRAWSPVESPSRSGLLPALTILLSFAHPALAQKCAQPELGDRARVYYRVEGYPGQNAGAVARGAEFTVATGRIVGYERDTLRLALSPNLATAGIPFANVTVMHIACGHHRTGPVVGSMATGALFGFLIGGLNPLGGEVDHGQQAGLTAMGALIGVPIGFVISQVTTRWVAAEAPPPTGILTAEEVRRRTAGRGRLTVGAALLATGLGLLAYDPSLSDDGTPRVILGAGIAIGVWGLVAMLR